MSLPEATAADSGGRLAGLMQRAAAFLIDLVLIYFVGYSLEMAARRPMLELGPLLPMGSTVLAFGYFWLGNGPLGSGTTLGKAIMNIRVTSKAGRPLSLGSSFRRALLQLPPSVVAVCGLTAEMARWPMLVSFYLLETLSLTANALMITHAYSILTHPHRRGWHDLWGDSYVITDPPSAALLQALAGPPEETLRRRLATHRRWTPLFGLVALLLLGIGWIGPAARTATRRELSRLDRLNRTYEVGNYRLQAVTLMTGEAWEQFRASYPPLGEDDRRTSPVLAVESGALVFHFFKSRGSVEAEDLLSPELRRQVERLREEAAPDYLADRRAEGRSPAPPEPDSWAAIFTDRFRFVIFSPGERRMWMAHGPLEPARAGLTYERLATQRPAAPARPTSDGAVQPAPADDP